MPHITPVSPNPCVPVTRIRGALGDKVLRKSPELFNQGLPTVLAEVLQNARRAGATRVGIELLGEEGRATLAVRDDGHGITNGPCLSPDGRTLYHHDTADRTIFAYDHEAGRIANPRPLAIPRRGYPDGPAVDADGTLWIGLFHGGGVARFDPDGTERETLAFPVPTVTKVAFGGEDLRTVYATTAWKGLDAAARAAHPAAGGLFRFRVETPGLAPNRIRL